jgi:hypothetical protein
MYNASVDKKRFGRPESGKKGGKKVQKKSPDNRGRFKKCLIFVRTNFVRSWNGKQ